MNINYCKLIIVNEVMKMKRSKLNNQNETIKIIPLGPSFL